MYLEFKSCYQGWKYKGAIKGDLPQNLQNSPFEKYLITVEKYTQEG